MNLVELFKRLEMVARKKVTKSLETTRVRVEKVEINSREILRWCLRAWVWSQKVAPGIWWREITTIMM